jgi:small conductance mechanosensitive channel
MSLGRQIAETTQAVAQDIASNLKVFWARLQNAPRTFSGLSGAELDVLLETLLDVAVVLATTVGFVTVLRALAKPLYRRMGNTAAESGLVGKALLISGSILIDAAVVILAWAVGYAVAVALFGEFGTIRIRQALYLNAFLMVELTKVLFRAGLSPSSGQLRLLAIPDGGARTLSACITVVVTLIGYGQLMIVPIINQNVSFFAGRGISALIVLVAVLIVAFMVLRHRRPVANWLVGGDTAHTPKGILRTMARIWHIPVLLYLAGLFALVVTRPGGLLLPLLGASAQVVLVIVVGVTLAGALKRTTASGVRVPDRVRQRLPLLEQRLNIFVPKVLFVLRYVLLLAVTAFIANAVDLIDVRQWLESQVGIRITGMIVSATLIVTVSFTLWLALISWIDYRLNPDFGKPATAREETLLILLRNAATIILLVVTLMFVLSEIGIDIAPLLASAGVLGLAIGFGAQKMVQDIITGIFIQFENAMNVGDVVTVGGTTGTVERLTIRSVSLRDLHGVFHIIPFSSVDMVSNHMRDFAHFLCDMGIAYRESVDDAKLAMHDAFDELRADPVWSGSIMGDLQWFGLQTFGDSAVVVRARIKCVPGQQWGVGRAYNEILKRIFDERGIEIPFPHQTLYFGEDKAGRAPALRLAGTGAPDGAGATLPAGATPS